MYARTLQVEYAREFLSSSLCILYMILELLKPIVLTLHNRIVYFNVIIVNYLRWYELY